MDLETLKKFCGSAFDPIWIQEVFTQGEFTWASDKYILIGVPIIDGIKKQDRPDIAKLYARIPSVPKIFYPIPDLPELLFETCDSCDGQGKIQDDELCEECGGEGRWPQYQPIKIGTCLFSDHLLAKIKTHIPGCQIGPTGKDTATYLKFDGGKGLLMPIKKVC